MMPIVQTMEIPVMNPIMRRMTPRMIKWGSYLGAAVLHGGRRIFGCYSGRTALLARRPAGPGQLDRP
jgi:hypothetical protein